MGLRDKALQFRKSLLYDKLDNLEEFYSDHLLNRDELFDLKSQIKKRIFEVTQQLDQRIHEMKSLFTVTCELFMVRDKTALFEKTLSIFSTHFQTKEIAVFLKVDSLYELSIQTGFADDFGVRFSPKFTQTLLQKESVLSVSDFYDCGDEYSALDRMGVRLVIPVMVREEYYGFIALGKKQESENYTDGEKNLMPLFCEAFGVALLNAVTSEEVKANTQKTDKKTTEISSLYEIGKILQSSNNLEEMLQLIAETLSVGFGITQAVLFLMENDSPMIRLVIGLSDELKHNAIPLSPSEIEGLDKYEPTYLGINPLFNEVKAHRYLLIPLSAMKKIVGGLMLFEWENQSVESENTELITNLSLLGSQFAPALLCAIMQAETKLMAKDPYHPVIIAMETEMESARRFGVGVVFAMLKLNAFSKWGEFYGYREAHEKMGHLSQRIKSQIPENARCYHYSAGKILLMIPAVSEGDFEDIREAVMLTALDIFKNDKEIDIGLDLLSAKYPENGADVYAILALIE